MSNNKKQDGFVAIIVAALIMVILALITIGFTRIMQREQRQALDRQLSRQALYAAESGINDVYEAIGTTYTDDVKTSCDPSALDSSVLDSESGVEYTCIQYNNKPPELEYELSPNKSEITQFVTSGTPFKSLTFSWGLSGDDNNLDALDALPECSDTSVGNLPTARPGTVPVLRVDLSSFNTISRDDIIDGSEFLYLIPCSGTGTTTHTFDSDTRGDVVFVRCSGEDSRPCSVTIDTQAVGSSKYISRLKSVYSGASVIITGFKGSATGDVSAEFIGVQTEIDVTAKANDVVRRLRAKVPFSKIKELTGIPEAVVHSFDGVCKQLSIDDNSSPNRLSSKCHP